jgi:hypothetical protein
MLWANELGKINDQEFEKNFTEPYRFSLTVLTSFAAGGTGSIYP